MARRPLIAAWIAIAWCAGLAEPTEAQAKPLGISSSREVPSVSVEQSRPRRHTTFDRRVSATFTKAKLDVAIDQLAAAAGVTIVYTDRVLPTDRLVSDSFADVPLGVALARVLQGTTVYARLSADRTIVLVKGSRSGSQVIGSITGQVTDSATGRGVPAAEVFLKGTNLRAQTDSAGRYHLVDVDSGTYTLTVRRLGYLQWSGRVAIRGDEPTVVNVKLAAAAVALDELVTTATGLQRRRDLGNAITTIRADSVLRTAPIRNLTDLLEDRVPGLNIQHTSGAPGDPARLRLRGISSVMRGNDPVVIVDGVRVYASQSDPRSGNLTNLGQGGIFGQQSLNSLNAPAPSPLDQIDPNTIDKIEVFKGPSAATLYGADAANGVIVITTKRGKPGPTTWQASIAHGRTNTPGRYPDGYYQWGHQVYTGAPMFCALANLECLPDSLSRFQALNDPDLTVLGRGELSNLSVTASGGSQALTYSITGTYSDETGLLTLPALEAERFRTRFNRDAPDWMQRPHQMKQWSVSSNVTALLSATADVTLSTMLSRSDQQRSSLESQVAALSGTYVDRVNGLYYKPNTGYVLATTADVLEDYYTRTTASSLRFTTGLNASWRPRPWFNANGQAGVDVMPRDDQVFLPAGTVAATDSGAIVQGTGRSLVSTFSVQGNVRRPLRWGFMFEAGIGANLLTTNTSDLISSASGLVPGTTTITGASMIRATNSQVSSSVFGWYIEPRITGQRLSLSTGIRLDGGSNYGTRVTGGGLLSLPKLNGSWVISEERFFPFKALFSSMRLRAAYGQAQVQPGPADRLRLYSRRLDQQLPLLTLTTLGNTQLRPERSTEFEGGVDADLFDSRVTVEFTAYRKMQVDALMPVNLPGSVNGGGSVIRNIGNIVNKGVELTLGVTPLQSSLLTWSAQLNYTNNSNKLVELGRGVEANPRQGIVEGYPVSGRWARPILGYGDADGNGVLLPHEVQLGDSLVYMGQLLPQHLTALHTNVALFGGAIGLTATVNYEAGGTQIDETARTNWVMARALIDRSAPLGDQAAVLVNDSTTYGLTQSITTFRFNALSVTYRAPARLARLLRAQQMTVSVQGRNLGLHSSYRGKDPDVNAWNPGETIVDTGQLPQPRTWQLAVVLRY